MTKKDRIRVRELLQAHAERLNEQSGTVQQIPMTDKERNHLDPLYRLAERLHHNMQPVQPSPAFVRRLHQEVLEGAESRIALTKRLRRTVLFAAAGLGSLLSIASVVGAIMFLVARQRAREQARAVHAPTG